MTSTEERYGTCDVCGRRCPQKNALTAQNLCLRFSRRFGPLLIDQDNTSKITPIHGLLRILGNHLGQYAPNIV